jgi:predicted metal-dependent HD superfamily phosphohydrolase
MKEHYHTVEHIDSMFRSAQKFSFPMEPQLVFSIFYHDVIYDSKKHDNEELSAQLAEKSLTALGLNQPLIYQISQLILCTKKHKAVDGDLRATSEILLDLDLLILGTAQEIYDDYAAKIRKEYSWVPEDQYRSGRAKILSSFLERPIIYFNEEIRADNEELARKNLERELNILQKGKPE